MHGDITLGALGERSDAPMPVAVMTDLAYELFHRLLRQARVGQWLGLIRGRSTALPGLADKLVGALPQPYRALGVTHVRVAQIIGSEGRPGDFDREFRPLQPYLGERWRQLAIHWMRGRPLPPVSLLQLGDTYVVRDGHHRISVARAFGAAAIEAVVEGSYGHPASHRT